MMKLAFFVYWTRYLLVPRGHGPIHLLIQSADEIVFFWDSE